MKPPRVLVLGDTTKLDPKLQEMLATAIKGAEELLAQMSDPNNPTTKLVNKQYREGRMGNMRGFEFYPQDMAQATEPQRPNPQIEDAIETLLSRHPTNEDQNARMELLRDAAKAFFYAIEQVCPKSADRSAAFRHVRDALMTANASIVIPPTPPGVL